jgi:hypothetical protein
MSPSSVVRVWDVRRPCAWWWPEFAPGRLRGRPGASLFVRLVVAHPDAEVMASVRQLRQHRGVRHDRPGGVPSVVSVHWLVAQGTRMLP